MFKWLGVLVFTVSLFGCASTKPWKVYAMTQHETRLPVIASDPESAVREMLEMIKDDTGEAFYVIVSDQDKVELVCPATDVGNLRKFRCFAPK